jgi:hypothetical protein
MQCIISRLDCLTFNITQNKIKQISRKERRTSNLIIRREYNCRPFNAPNISGLVKFFTLEEEEKNIYFVNMNLVYFYFE